MARVNVYLPDELVASIKAKVPDLNLSGHVRESLIALLACRHDSMRCADCSAVMTRREIIDAPLSAFYRDLMAGIDRLMRSGGTAEGAGRVLKDVGERHRVSVAASIPLPRPSRAAQRAHKIREMYPDQPAKAAAINRRATA